MRLIAILMALAIFLMAYEFNEVSYWATVQLGEKKWAYCPDELVRSVVTKAETIYQNIQYDSGYSKKMAEATNKAERYEYMKIAQKIDKQINDEIEAFYNKYMNIATKIAEDMCDIRNSSTSYEKPYKSKLSPEEVYQHLEEYFK